MNNNYEIRDNVAAIFLYSKGKHIETLIDLEDLDKAKDFNYKWSALLNRYGRIYAYLNIYSEQRTVYLHRIVLNTAQEMEIDHINSDGLDNRKSNLRVTTHAENMQNLGLRANNTSGFRGVSWNKEKRKWETNVRINNKVHKLGYFSDLQDAANRVSDFRKEFMPYSNEGEQLII